MRKQNQIFFRASHCSVLRARIRTMMMLGALAFALCATDALGQPPWKPWTIKNMVSADSPRGGSRALDLCGRYRKTAALLLFVALNCGHRTW